MQLTRDEKGRFIEVPAASARFPATCSSPAGFLGSQPYVAEAFGAPLTPRTNVDTAPGGYKTSVPKLFAAGDMHRGQSLVVWAIAEGRSAAREVDEF